MLAFLAVSSAYPDALTTLLHGKFDRAPVGLFLCARRRLRVPRPLRDREDARAAARARRRRGATATRSSRPACRRSSSSTTRPSSARSRRSSCRAPTLYFLFILLATLRLDFALCAFTGLVAAVEYAAVALFWGSRDTTVAGAGAHVAAAAPGEGVHPPRRGDRGGVRRAPAAQELHARARVARGARAHPRRLRPARLTRGRRPPRVAARPRRAASCARSA